MNKLTVFFLALLSYSCIVNAQKDEYLEKVNYFISDGQKLDSAMFYIDAVLKNDRNDIEANFMKLQVMELQKNCGKMEEILNILTDIKNVNKDNLYYFKARKLICEQKPEQATALLEDYLIQNPDSYLILLELGNEYINLQDYDSGIEKLYKAIVHNPQRIDAYAVLSNLFNQLGKYNENILMLKRGLEATKGQKDDFYQLLSAAYISMGYYGRAEYYIDKAIAITTAPYYLSQKNYIDTEQNKLYIEYQKNKSLLSSESCQGKVLSDILEYEYAFDMPDEMVKSAYKGVDCNFTKEQFMYFYNRILIGLLYQKKYNETENLLKQIVDKNNAGFNEYFMLALLQADKGNYQAALDYCEKALAFKQNSDLDYLKIFLMVKLNMPGLNLQVEKIKKDGNMSYLLNSILETGNKKGATKFIFNPNKDFKVFETTYEYSGKDLEMLMKAIKA